jgi:hypothetical protein
VVDSVLHLANSVTGFVVGNTVTSTANNGPIPDPLRAVPFPPSTEVADRHFTFERQNGRWEINGVCTLSLRLDYLLTQLRLSGAISTNESWLLLSEAPLKSGNSKMEVVDGLIPSVSRNAKPNNILLTIPKISISLISKSSRGRVANVASFLTRQHRYRMLSGLMLERPFVSLLGSLLGQACTCFIG